MMMMKLDGKSSSSSSSSVLKPPGWLEGLMRETFFESCVLHHHKRKNEKNIFCLHCCLSFCLHCLPSHPSNHHPLLQVRRYVYHDVVRLEDLEKLIDCSYIQGYTINGAKVIFLNERAQSTRSTSNSTTSTSSSSKGSAANFCLGCCRILQHPYLFCSLSCKVDYMVYQREDLSSIISCRFDDPILSHHHHHMTTFESMANPQNLHVVLEYPAGPGHGPASSTLVDHTTNNDHDNDNDDDLGQLIINNNNNNNNNNIDPIIIKGKNKSKSRRGSFMQSMSGTGIGIHVDLPATLMTSNRRKGAPTRSPLS